MKDCKSCGKICFCGGDFDSATEYPSPKFERIIELFYWYQVMNSEAVFAIGKFKTKLIVDGGTGWAVQMGIDNNKPVFFFNQPTNCWNTYAYDTKEFRVMYELPKLTENFAGIGTRALDNNGKKAIIKVYEHTFNS